MGFDDYDDLIIKAYEDMREARKNYKRMKAEAGEYDPCGEMEKDRNQAKKGYAQAIRNLLKCI